MDRLVGRARASLGSGLFVGLAGLSLACSTVGASLEPESEPRDAALEQGSIDPAGQAESDRLVAQAESALDAGDALRAEELAMRVEASHAAAQGSSRALWIRARAALVLGRAEAALSPLRRFRSYLAEDDDRQTAVAILEGDVLAAGGRTREAAEAWMAAPAEGRGEDVLERLGRHVAKLAEAELTGLAERRGPYASPVLAELALRRYARGEGDAPALAREALEAGASGRARLIAEGVLSGRLDDFLTTPVIGAILPTSGSPRLREFAELLQDGIRIALEEFGQPQSGRTATELVMQDNRGVVGNAPRILEAFDSANALGIVGPLQDGALSEVARRRPGTLAVVSPTAPLVPEDVQGVYSLSGDDPGASRVLARYAMGSRLGTAVVMYPASRHAAFEARSFVETFEALGGAVLREFTYASGATFFGEQLQQVESLRPDALVLPLPAGDVELMAPQVTFYGLDSLEIRVLGTAGWTDEDVLSNVATRHTNGVVAASPRPPGGDSEGYRRFVEAYEAYHQRTLPSRVPALGYDAAALLLEGIRRGAHTRSELLANLEEISGFAGATGILSVEEGRVVREHYVVCIQDRRVESVADGARAEPILMPPLPDPETDSIPEDAPDRIVGFRCPGPSPPPLPGDG